MERKFIDDLAERASGWVECRAFYCVSRYWWVSPYINHFIQPDTIIPDQADPQSWNRYTYVSNNPLRYTDPTGHKAVSDADGAGCPSQDLFCQLAGSGYKQKSKEEIAKDLRAERPISGLHLGVSSQKGFIKDTGAYLQLDFLMDWKIGSLYVMSTVGTFGSFGSPTGEGAEVYGGTTVVHGIPLYGEDDISVPLRGTNTDGAITVGGDALGKLSGTKGLSVDLDDSLHPIHTGAGVAGYQYAVENSVEFGANAVPNAIEIGAEGGMSYTEVLYKNQFAWWPFR